jgi:penicillin-binding protein 2
VARTADRPGAPDSSVQRSRHLRFAVLFLFVLIVGRLGWLQLARGGFYRDLSRENYVQGFPIRAPRGVIKDRNGEILADNRASLSITLARTRSRDDEAMADALSQLLGLDRSSVAEKLKEARSRFFGSVLLVEDATFEQVSRIEERRYELPGVKVEVTATRRYPAGEFAMHALGHVGQISETELEGMEPLGYSAGDIVGKAGAERRYELQVRGWDGGEYWVCDASGRELYPWSGGPVVEARPGNTLVLAIDAPAQRVAEEALTRYGSGAVVALDPRTGETLVLASRPAPDPNALSQSLSTKDWNALVNSPAHPLINRAIQATYPPGSTFKLITASTGLATGLITSTAPRVMCPGSLRFGTRTFKCWRPEGHGTMDLLAGITQSCDVYFYTLGVRLGVGTLMSWAERSGVGRRTGIDIAGEVAGNAPTPAWFDRRYGKGRWSRGVVLNLAIGQGEILVTPLQAACLVCGIVNGGPVPVPHVLKQVESPSGRVIGTARSRVGYELPYTASTLRFIRDAMVSVVEAPRGTGWQARIPGMQVGGKTGTAQNPHGEDHAWFVSFAPADDPKIVVAVLVENAGGGGAIAAPIARDVMKAYLRIADPVPPAPGTEAVTLPPLGTEGVVPPAPAIESPGLPAQEGGGVSPAPAPEGGT